MLQSKIKAWNGKQVQLSYSYEYNGKPVNMEEEIEFYRQDIVKQGFTFEETEYHLIINETGQSIEKYATKHVTGIIQARSNDVIIFGDSKTGKLFCEYPTKENLLSESETGFSKFFDRGIRQILTFTLL